MVEFKSSVTKKRMLESSSTLKKAAEEKLSISIFSAISGNKVEI